MEKIGARIVQLELLVESLDEKVMQHDKTLSHIKPAVQQSANKTVVVWIAVVITVLNCIILLLNET